MSGLEGRILTLVKELAEEKRLADKRAKQLYLAGASFIGHDDTPAAYAGQAGKFIKVNATPDALEFVDHNKTLHDALALDHGALGGKGDDDHSQYYNATRHTKAVHDALGINAGTVDGFSASQTRNLANTCAVRDASGYLQLGWINTTSGSAGTTAPDRIYGSYDPYIRYYTPANFATVMKPYFDDHFLLLTGQAADSHKVDGYHAAEASTVSTIAVRNSSGDINARLFKSEYDTTNPTCNYIMTQIDTVSNNYMRPSTKAQLIASLNLMTKAGGTFTGHVYARDHGTAATDSIINVCYGTGSPPSANSTTIGTLFVKYV